MDLQSLWVYLAARPLSALLFTLLAYQAGLWLYQRSGRRTWCNPVLIAVLLLSGLLKLSDTDYATYFEGAQFVHFLLGPATVALAVPIYRQWQAVRRSIGAIAMALTCGSATAITSALLVGWAAGATPAVLASLAPKSVTTPIAMSLAEYGGGLVSLTAVLVIVTGILGAMVGPPLLDLIRVRDPHARGLALGAAAHGIGTARAVQESTAAAAFAGLAIGLNGLATALLLPWIYALFF